MLDTTSPDVEPPITGRLPDGRFAPGNSRGQAGRNRPLTRSESQLRNAVARRLMDAGRSKRWAMFRATQYVLACRLLDAASTWDVDERLSYDRALVRAEEQTEEILKEAKLDRLDLRGRPVQVACPRIGALRFGHRILPATPAEVDAANEDDDASQDDGAEVAQ